MKFFNSILDFYITTSIHVALAVVALLHVTCSELAIVVDYRLSYFVFAATVLGYNALKYIEVIVNKRLILHKKPDIVIVSCFAFLIMLYNYVQLLFVQQLSITIIGLLVAIYPFVRKYWFLKMIYVAMCLTMITVYLPIINQKIELDYCFHRLIIIFCLLIPVEICDQIVDEKTIVTLPKIIGICHLKIFGYLLLVFFNMMALSISNIIFSALIALAIQFSDKNNSKYYCSFLVESLPVFWLILLLFMPI